MSKQIVQGQEARKKLMAGLNAVVDAVKITIGPKGRNVIIDKGYEPLIANDAGSIAKEIILKDKIENMGAQVIKSVIQRTSEKVGGGRTASAILTQALVEEGMKMSDKGMNMTLIKKGMNLALKNILENLKTIARPCTTQKELKQVATISTESEELGEVISEVVYKIGKDGIVTVEESQSTGTTIKFTDGLEFDKGWISPWMITNPQKMESELIDVPVLITDKKISLFKDIFPVIDKIKAGGGHNLFIICEDMDGEALNQVIVNGLKGIFHTLVVKAPGFGDLKKYCIEDLCAITGAELQDSKLGSAKKVIATKDTCRIIEGGGQTQLQIATLKAQKEATESKMLKSQLEERIAKLSNSVAIIKVGASSESELKYLKLKIEDGVNEAKRALEEGIVPGGDVAFIHARGKNPTLKGEELIGFNIVNKAIEAPLRQIVLNSNGSPDVIINDLKGKDTKSGYNALTNEIVADMFKYGIIDAVKVTRTVLENAISSASMFLTAEVAIADVDEPLPRQPIEY